MIDCSAVDTSRYPPDAQVYGEKGIFLYSIAALSLLVITSKTKNAASQSSLVIHNGELLGRYIPAPPEHAFSAHSHGTRVAISDLFGSMPVRAKHRAVMLSSKVDAEKEIRRLAYTIIATLLASPISVDVTLRDARHEKEFRLRSMKNIRLEQQLSNLLPHIGLPSYINSSTMVPTQANSDGISISGCISLEPSATRLFQIITIGIYPIVNEYGYNVLFEEINKAFTASDFGVNKKGAGTNEAERAANKKSFDKWPVFFLKVNFTNSTLEDSRNNLIEGDWKLGLLLQLLRAMCYSFLKKHHFRPRKPQKRVNTVPEQKGTRRSARLADIKQSVATNETVLPSRRNWKVGSTNARRTLAENTTPGSAVSPKPLVGFDGRLLRLPFDVALAGSSQEALSALIDEPHEQSLSWIQQLLDNWKNPTFEPAELQIPATNVANGESCTDTCGFNHIAGTMDLNGHLSKSSLASATVIAQVDEKFILVKLPLEVSSHGTKQSTASTLVLVDQHAADERCRLEDLMATYFSRPNGEDRHLTAVLQDLNEPIQVEVSVEEARLLARRQHFLQSWGISFHVNGIATTDTKPSTRATVTVVAISPAIFARCQTEHHLLVDIVRSEAWREGSAVPSVSQYMSESKNGYLPSFQGCPRGILDLLQSRSCRSMSYFKPRKTHDANQNRCHHV